MASQRPKSCRVCGRRDSPATPISWRGKCLPCAQRLQAENIDGLHTMEGVARDRWRRGMILSAGGLLPDRLRDARS